MLAVEAPIESQMTNRAILKAALTVASGGTLAKLLSRAAIYLLSDDVSTNISDKISRQMGKRGWAVGDIEETINSPHTTRSAVNKANDNPATAFFNKDGSYVVRDNKTGNVIQISNKNDPNWVPDPTIKNPYRR